MISAIGLISALALLIWMTIRGVNILIAGPAAAAVVALTSGIAWLPPLAAESAPNFATSYMDGFVGFFADWFFIFLLGAIFGEVMGRTGAAASIAHAVTKALGPRFALAAVVLAVRHPMAILASHHAKWEYDIQVDWLTYLKGDPGGSKYRCDLYWLARFWNRWGDIRARHDDTIHVVQYEQTQKDPRAVLQAVSDHWSLGLTPVAIEVALAAGTKDAMAQKIDPDAEPNVLQNRKTPLSELFTGEAPDSGTPEATPLPADEETPVD